MMPLLRCRWHHLHMGVKLAARAVRETGQLVSYQHTLERHLHSLSQLRIAAASDMAIDRAAESSDHF